MYPLKMVIFHSYVSLPEGINGLSVGLVKMRHIYIYIDSRHISDESTLGTNIS